MRELDGVDPSGAEKKSEEKGGSCTGSTVACAILVFTTAASRESNGSAVDGELLSRANTALTPGPQWSMGIKWVPSGRYRESEMR